MFIYLLLYIVCDSSSGYVLACVLYVICLLYSHLSSVNVNGKVVLQDDFPTFPVAKYR